MAESKSFFDVFSRYNPSEEKRALLMRAKDAKFRYKKEPEMQIEVELSFDGHEDAEIIYDIEDECRVFYNAASFKIIPHFPSECYNISRFGEITFEAARCGAITHGFFNGAEYFDDGECVKVAIPFFERGIDFVRNAGTESILAGILRSRYGVDRRVVICESAGADEFRRSMDAWRRDVLVEAEREGIERARQERAAFERQKAAEAELDPHYGFEERAGISPLTGQNSVLGENLYRMGASTYNVEGAESILGQDFDVIEPTPLSDIAKSGATTVYLGTVYSVETKETRNGDKLNCTIGISDGASGVYLRKMESIDSVDWLKSIKPGTHLAVLGRPRRDKFDNELSVDLKAAKKIKKIERRDDAPVKRTELHLHTSMSSMDAIITPAELVDTALRWGHSAIAVTDHGNVQSFPEVMLAVEKAEKSGKGSLKILYGMEAYFVNDTAKCIFGKTYPAFDDEMVVFDIETTGLSNKTSKIIEIGAVKIKGGSIIDRFDIMVDPECEISEEITNLTSITNEMVKGAPKEPEAMRMFFDFVGDDMLIAHNANFDTGFIRVAAERCGMPFTNTYLDTLGLSRYVNPELTKHKLDIIAKHYGVKQEHHHRADDDAEVLANIFFVMLERLRSEGINTFAAMLDTMSENTDPLKLRPHHMVIFAKNKEGLKNLYKLISASYLDYYHRFPRIPKTVLEQYREGLIIGSACEAGELYRAIIDGRSNQEIEEIAEFYDYLEIQPLGNNRFLIEDPKTENVRSDDDLKAINMQIYELGKKLGKPVCATCDAHFINPEEEIYRRVLLAGMKFKDADKPTPIWLRNTEEMLLEFDYMGEDVAREVVIENPAKIAEMCERIRPIPEGRYDPDLPGAKEELTESCWRRAHEWYGDELPKIVEDRLNKELTSIIKNGFAVLYMIAVKLVAYSESLGYQVGSRGSVGSSFVATMSGISEVNPLPPHYRCLKCRYNEFITDGSVGSGFDLEDKRCPVCGEWLYQDGHDIPFETFLGFYGDKSPDIDLNFSGDVQGKVHKYTEELFGKGHVFRAGTTSGLADKTAWGYINKYLEERKITIPKGQVGYMVTKIMGIKKTTGQHPGGIIVVPNEYDIYDFTPVQHPADDPKADTVTTHFQFSYLHDTILKLDELGHDIPTKYKMLEKYTNTSVLDVKMNDKTIYEIFTSTKPLGIKPEDIGGAKLATFGIPEFGTRFLQQVLLDAQPKTFADLLQISGLTHGTGCWLGNADELIKAGTCTISTVIGCRDDIMNALIRYGLDNSTAFKIMESVRKGKGLTPEWEEIMLENNVPQWYLDSCKKIKYMFPKAHAAAYVMSAIRLVWYKIYYPMEFYAAFLTVAPGGFDGEIAARGYNGVNDAIKALEEKGNEATAKENAQLSTFYLVREAMARGVQFLGVDLEKSDASAFLPENGKIRMPFNSLPELGDTAAEKIVETRDNYNICSIEELRLKAGLNTKVIEILRRNHVLDKLTETNQLSFF